MRSNFPSQPRWHSLLQLADQFTSADIISTVEFDQTGNYLATGDKGGRVVLFERNDTVRYNLFPPDSELLPGSD